MNWRWSWYCDGGKLSPAGGHRAAGEQKANGRWQIRDQVSGGGCAGRDGGGGAVRGGDGSPRGQMMFASRANNC